MDVVKFFEEWNAREFTGGEAIEQMLGITSDEAFAIAMMIRNKYPSIGHEIAAICDGLVIGAAIAEKRVKH